MKKDKLIIIGASGHGKVAVDIAIKMKKWRDIFFIDDNESINKCLGIKVIGKIDDAYSYKNNADFFVAIGNNLIRKKIMENFIKKELNIVNLIHPSSTIGVNVEIGIGTIIMAGVVINSSSCIGKGCIINTSASLDHDNIIGNFVHISPGVNLAGNVNVGSRSWLGIGSVVSNNVNLCTNCMIGAGAVVVKDINEEGIYVGVPARRICL